MKISAQSLLQRTLVGTAVIAVAAAASAPSTVRGADANEAVASNTAASNAAPSAAPVSFPSSADKSIRQLIQQLDSDTFAARDYAAQRLLETGRPAIAPLAEAARGHSLEQSSAAVQILRRFLKSDDASAKQSAKAALEEVAKNGSASVASLAASALRPPAAIQPTIYPQWGGPIIRMGNIRGPRFRGRIVVNRGMAPLIVVGPAAGPVQPANNVKIAAPAQPATPARQKSADAKR